MNGPGSGGARMKEKNVWPGRDRKETEQRRVKCKNQRNGHIPDRMLATDEAGLEPTNHVGGAAPG
ncbi:hypothetical protein ZHAS_00009754 [Anopheles sinensis]|uniref:Uncharacterized protein n=1 Tax=Anopheles sinensis TaxID=74873 RepID=A0A084VVV1_ANOSI|nr:hypothetical protein ZHAS_00009754 [Anopheles sinensis]